MSEAGVDAAATAPVSDKEEPAAKRLRHNPGPKRKVALLVAYNGAAYQGLQRNPNAKTIEDVLEAAMHAAGAVSNDNVGTLQKISWSKAGRTDKGVHAAGQVISCKLIVQPSLGGGRAANDDGQCLDNGADEQAALAGTMAAVNAQLARACSDVRVLRLERVTNSFCAHTSCSSREYEYLIPAYCLRPPHASVLEDVQKGAEEASDPAVAASRPASAEPGSSGAQGQEASGEASVGRGDADPLDETEIARVNAALATMQGTHYFHNFTDTRGLSGPKDRCASRVAIAWGNAAFPCPPTLSRPYPPTVQRNVSFYPRARERSGAWAAWRTCRCCTTASPSCFTRFGR
jgi:tRNA pseudouridine38-40 synthase